MAKQLLSSKSRTPSRRLYKCHAEDSKSSNNPKRKSYMSRGMNHGVVGNGPFLCSWMAIEQWERVGGSQKKNIYRYVICLMVDMDECTLDIGQNLNLVLKLLADIVCFPQGCRSVHDNVHFDEVVRTTLGKSSSQQRQISRWIRTWYALTVSIFSISSLNVIAL